MRGVLRADRTGRHSERREVAGRAAMIVAVSPSARWSMCGQRGQPLGWSRSTSGGEDPQPPTVRTMATSNILIKTDQFGGNRPAISGNGQWIGSDTL